MKIIKLTKLNEKYNLIEKKKEIIESDYYLNPCHIGSFYFNENKTLGDCFPGIKINYTSLHMRNNTLEWVKETPVEIIKMIISPFLNDLEGGDRG